MHRLLLLAAALVLSAAPAFAAPKSCDDLLAEITQKIEKSGARTYVLEILPADRPDPRTVVGTCETGTKKIVYARQ